MSKLMSAIGAGTRTFGAAADAISRKAPWLFLLLLFGGVGLSAYQPYWVAGAAACLLVILAAVGAPQAPVLMEQSHDKEQDAA